MADQEQSNDEEFDLRLPRGREPREVIVDAFNESLPVVGTIDWIWAGIAAMFRDVVGLGGLLVGVIIVTTLIPAIWLMRAVWKQRRLVESTRYRFEDGELVCTRQDGWGPDETYRFPIEELEGVRTYPVGEADLQEALPPERHWELTVVTREGMETTSVGVRKRDARWVVDAVDAVLDGREAL